MKTHTLSTYLDVLYVKVCYHNLFDKNPAFRNISLNSRYVVVFKNPRDGSSITNFAKQFDPNNSKRLIKIYQEATAKPYSYLFIDMDQLTPDEYRLRSNVLFENGRPMSIYERS